jgi:hypothetical protein
MHPCLGFFFKCPSSLYVSHVERVGRHSVLSQLIQPLPLRLDRQLGVTDHVNEEDMPDLKSEFLLISLGMGLF